VELGGIYGNVQDREAPIYSLLMVRIKNTEVRKAELTCKYARTRENVSV